MSKEGARQVFNLSQRQQVSPDSHVNQWSVPRTLNKVRENLTNNKSLIINKHRNVLSILCGNMYEREKYFYNLIAYMQNISGRLQRNWLSIFSWQGINWLGIGKEWRISSIYFFLVFKFEPFKYVVYSNFELWRSMIDIMNIMNWR